MSLRERKKQTTRNEILKAAEEIFLTDGYANTTIEQIAKKAVVGTGTIYNYFKSKADLFVAVVMNDNEDPMDMRLLFSEEFLTQHTPYSAIMKLIKIGLKSIESISKDLWGEILKVIFSNLDDKEYLTSKFFSFDEEFINGTMEILNYYKQIGKISTQFQVENAARCIYDIVLAETMIYVMLNTISYESYTQNIERLLFFTFKEKFNL